MVCAKKLRLVPFSGLCDVKELVSGRGLGDIMRHKTKTGKICHISERAEIKYHRMRCRDVYFVT